MTYDHVDCFPVGLLPEPCCPFQATYEDAMNLLAKLPPIAATIYRNVYRDGSVAAAIDNGKDWSHNFAAMLGYDDATFVDLMRLYLVIHR